MATGTGNNSKDQLEYLSASTVSSNPPITMVHDLNMGALAAVLVVIVILDYIRVWLRPVLRTLPGPALARFTYLYRLLIVYRGKAPSNYRRLHEKYGPIVRVGPNEVSVADPTMIPIIYGIGSKFTKVSNPPPPTTD